MGNHHGISFGRLFFWGLFPGIEHANPSVSQMGINQGGSIDQPNDRHTSIP